jgi:hypothetical protein
VNGSAIIDPAIRIIVERPEKKSGIPGANRLLYGLPPGGNPVQGIEFYD